MITAIDYATFLNQSSFDLLYPDARAVLNFWFNPENAPYWFVADDDFDQRIDSKFNGLWKKACQGELAHWRRADSQSIKSDDNTLIHNALENSALENLAGRLAEIIVLDQFSRNLCRDQACSFSQDNMALVLAQEAIVHPYFNKLPMQWRKFIIMPFMHSESAVIHERYLPLFEQLDDSETLDFEHKHYDIIKKFGRYPHRNAVLDRESTATEKEFLQQPDSAF